VVKHVDAGKNNLAAPVDALVTVIAVDELVVVGNFNY
jgi:hypothetical protein